jgi:DNA-binding NarL/FixJ family response regulator
MKGGQRVTRVLVVSNQSMFSQGLEGLLREHHEIDLIDRQVPADALRECLEQCQPDVLFFGCSDPEECPSPAFMRCLQEGMVKRIVCMNLDDNAAYVFHGERHAVEQIQDLVEAITYQVSGTVGDQPGCQGHSPANG